ncbi:crossover junction endodeoxyribonuclease RuvC [Patescibacteria group bacterium]|nr:crossover junction endodeoxyribonuclease RuvC [Patescibacteria group bacterium]MBU0923046.1 crossover junction endodeoxyribonuclease RuvC [Patescibacteria group bacterium]MBU1844870.1 crossover junction endodeoxyribonuclease RuvC [Patescibacteria group bacterium]
MKDMLILGIDPGTATTGYGIIKVENKNYDVVDFGLIETDKNGSPGKRLEIIYMEMMKIFRKHKPDVMAIEKIFFARNAKTAIRVGQALGVMLFSAARANTEIAEYAPGRIKKVVTGDGRADKKIIQKSVRKILGAKVRSKKGKKTHFDNAADGLAVALCHARCVVGSENVK